MYGSCMLAHIWYTFVVFKLIIFIVRNILCLFLLLLSSHLACQLAYGKCTTINWHWHLLCSVCFGGNVKVALTIKWIMFDVIIIWACLLLLSGLEGWCIAHQPDLHQGPCCGDQLFPCNHHGVVMLHGQQPMAMLKVSHIKSLPLIAD
jgi:hypothetical protein